VSCSGSGPEILGRSRQARELRRFVEVFGPTDLAVLVQGETGVGKEVVAGALHRRSQRPGRFVPVNVAAIPSELLEAELFGSVKGAFTGAARSRPGLVRAADGGTLFFDEVGDLSPPLQSKMLRFLESREVRAVGSTTFDRVDVRVLSATNRDLQTGIEEGWFRSDLYYRLASAAVQIPPLRDRKEDIGLFAEFFGSEVTQRLGLARCRWAPCAERSLFEHTWPGNVRELRHAVEVALVRAAGGTVTSDLLALANPSPKRPALWHAAVHDFRLTYLRTALQRNHGNRTATARELGISRQTLHYHMRNLGL
jgi:transcriptional regulator with PAS, ATPase and Fis domain